MWNTSLVLPSVSTSDNVLEKLQSGADLMTPGLTSWDPEIKAGDITAITLENSVPVAVGVAAFDVGDLSRSKGGKGKAIYLIHCHHDQLWGLGSKTDPPSPLRNEPKIEPLLESAQQLSLGESERATDDAETSEQPVDESPTVPDEKIQEPSTSGYSL
jgi:predicted RNA-binding protein (TIGR00451 family)